MQLTSSDKNILLGYKAQFGRMLEPVNDMYMKETDPATKNRIRGLKDNIEDAMGNIGLLINDKKAVTVPQ